MKVNVEDQEERLGSARLREQKARYRLRTHLRRPRHPFVRLAGQRFDAHVREDEGQGLGNVAVTRAFGADLEQHRDAQITKAFRLEVVAAQCAQIA